MTNKSRLIEACAKHRVRTTTEKLTGNLRDILPSHNFHDLLSRTLVKSSSGISLEYVVRLDIECRARHTSCCLVFESR